LNKSIAYPLIGAGLEIEVKMSAEKNKTIVRRYYEEVVNTGKVEGIMFC